MYQSLFYNKLGNYLIYNEYIKLIRNVLTELINVFKKCEVQQRHFNIPLKVKNCCGSAVEQGRVIFDAQ